MMLSKTCSLNNLTIIRGIIYNKNNKITFADQEKFSPIY